MAIGGEVKEVRLWDQSWVENLVFKLIRFHKCDVAAMNENITRWIWEFIMKQNTISAQNGFNLKSDKS